MTQHPSDGEQPPPYDLGVDRLAREPESDGARAAATSEPGAVRAGAAPEAGVDLGRRTFFRTFGRESLQAAGAMVGVANALRSGATTATSELLGLGLDDPAARRLGPPAPERPTSAGQDAVPYRSPYRLADGVLRIVDQRQLPHRLVELECRTAGEVAGALRAGVLPGGPVLGQVAAYGLALTGWRTRDEPYHVRRAVLRAGGAALKKARPASRAVSVTVDRLLERWSSLGETAPGGEGAQLLRGEADMVATAASYEHARLGRTGADLLAVPADRPLELLIHGAVGALGGGLVGTAMAVVQAAVTEGRSVHVFLTVGSVDAHGGLLAWESAKAGVAHTLVAEGAVGWLLAERPVDAVLLGAEWIAANGDTAAATGSFPIAVLAARMAVPVYVCTPLLAIADKTPNGAAIPREMREAGARLTAAEAAQDPAAAVESLLPAVDVTSGECITGFVTAEGLLVAPYAESLAAATGSAA
ncbi:MAG: hypothetical protein H0V12_06040 [Chloroflexi bacterium]|nr:hypothetical protein [Chloroflexota bacterium]